MAPLAAFFLFLHFTLTFGQTSTGLQSPLTNNNIQRLSQSSQGSSTNMENAKQILRRALTNFLQKQGPNVQHTQSKKVSYTQNSAMQNLPNIMPVNLKESRLTMNNRGQTFPNRKPKTLNPNQIPVNYNIAPNNNNIQTNSFQPAATNRFQNSIFNNAMAGNNPSRLNNLNNNYRLANRQNAFQLNNQPLKLEQMNTGNQQQNSAANSKINNQIQSNQMFPQQSSLNIQIEPKSKKLPTNNSPMALTRYQNFRINQRVPYVPPEKFSPKNLVSSVGVTVSRNVVKVLPRNRGAVPLQTANANTFQINRLPNTINRQPYATNLNQQQTNLGQRSNQPVQQQNNINQQSSNMNDALLTISERIKMANNQIPPPMLPQIKPEPLVNKTPYLNELNTLRLANNNINLNANTQRRPQVKRPITNHLNVVPHTDNKQIHLQNHRSNPALNNQNNFSPIKSDMTRPQNSLVYSSNSIPNMAFNNDLNNPLNVNRGGSVINNVLSNNKANTNMQATKFNLLSKLQPPRGLLNPSYNMGAQNQQSNIQPNLQTIRNSNTQQSQVQNVKQNMISHNSMGIFPPSNIRSNFPAQNRQNIVRNDIFRDISMKNTPNFLQKVNAPIESITPANNLPATPADTNNLAWNNWPQNMMTPLPVLDPSGMTSIPGPMFIPLMPQNEYYAWLDSMTLSTETTTQTTATPMQPSTTTPEPLYFDFAAGLLPSFPLYG